MVVSHSTSLASFYCQLSGFLDLNKALRPLCAQAIVSHKTLEPVAPREGRHIEGRHIERRTQFCAAQTSNKSETAHRHVDMRHVQRYPHPTWHLHAMLDAFISWTTFYNMKLGKLPDSLQPVLLDEDLRSRWAPAQPVLLLNDAHHRVPVPPRKVHGRLAALHRRLRDEAVAHALSSAHTSMGVLTDPGTSNMASTRTSSRTPRRPRAPPPRSNPSWAMPWSARRVKTSSEP